MRPDVGADMTFKIHSEGVVGFLDGESRVVQHGYTGIMVSEWVHAAGGGG